MKEYRLKCVYPSLPKDWYSKNEIVSSGDGYKIKVLGINFAKTNKKQKN